MIRTRIVYLLAATVVVIAGLASRRYRGQLPSFLAEYAWRHTVGIAIGFVVEAAFVAKTENSKQVWLCNQGVRLRDLFDPNNVRGPRRGE